MDAQPNNELGESSNQTAASNGSQASSHKTTNGLVASRLLSDKLSLSTTTVQTVLDLINDPSFDKSSLSLRSYADAFMYNASESVVGASKRSHLAASLRNFPAVILDSIIDIIDSERLSVSMGTEIDGFNADVMFTGSDGHDAWVTLSSMSLVHRSWTWPAQKALGRQIHIAGQDIRLCKLIRKAIKSPLFGPWTRRAYIDILCWHSLSVGNNDDVELLHLLTMLLQRIPKLHHLTFGLEWSHEFSMENPRELYSSIFSQLESFKHIRSMVFMERTNPTPPFLIGLMANLLAKLSSLETLTLATWSCYVSPHPNQPNSSIFNGIEPPERLKRIRITYGPSVPSEFLTWLFKPKASTKAMPIEELILNVSATKWLPGHPGATMNTGTITAAITAMNAYRSLALLQNLTLSFGCGVAAEEAESAVAEILDCCSSLRSCMILPSGIMDISRIFHYLPPTLTHIHCSQRLTDGSHALVLSVGEFEEAASSWLQSCAFRISHPHLRSISLDFSYQVCVPMNDWGDDQIRAEYRDAPMPKLQRVVDACKSLGVVLKTHWTRTLVPTPTIFQAHPQLPHHLPPGFAIAGQIPGQVNVYHNAGAPQLPLVYHAPLNGGHGVNMNMNPNLMLMQAHANVNAFAHAHAHAHAHIQQFAPQLHAPQFAPAFLPPPPPQAPPQFFHAVYPIEAWPPINQGAPPPLGDLGENADGDQNDDNDPEMDDGLLVIPAGG